MHGQHSNQPEPAFDFLKKYPSVRDFTMTADGSEIYFTIQNPLEEIGAIVCAMGKNGKFKKITLLPFSGKFRDIEPALSPDGLKLFFSSNRPLHQDSAKTKDYDIWYVERSSMEAHWTEPKNIGEPINTAADEFFPSIASNGNLYFTSERENAPGGDDIFMSKWNGTYSTPVALSAVINTNKPEFNAYIAPDESFLIYTAYQREGNVGSGDLWISFNKDGTWSNSIHTGSTINSKWMDYCPFVVMNSKTLYYTSRRSKLPTRAFVDFKELEAGVLQYENGLSRLYKVSIGELLNSFETPGARR